VREARGAREAREAEEAREARACVVRLGVRAQLRPLNLSLSLSLERRGTEERIVP